VVAAPVPVPVGLGRQAVRLVEQGPGPGAEPGVEATDVVGRQAVEEGPDDEFLGVGRAAGHLLQSGQAPFQGGSGALDLRHQPGHVVGQLGEDGGGARVPVGPGDQFPVAVSEFRCSLQELGHLVVHHVVEVYGIS
jgi:hypothetical protein